MAQLPAPPEQATLSRSVENTRWTPLRCNYAKSDDTYPEFLQWRRRLVTFQITQQELP